MKTSAHSNGIGWVIATPEAEDAIMRQRARHGLVALHQCSLPGLPRVCITEPLPPAPNEIQLGEVGGVPFLIDCEQYRCWGSPNLVVDVIPGSDDTFSLTVESIRHVPSSAED